MACMQKFGSSAQYIPVNSIKDVFSEVERGRANFGVVPIENTTEGVVTHTLDMFIDSNLLIYGEILQEVSHHLMSKSGVMEEVKNIHSHPHAIAQCRNWMETNLPNVPSRRRGRHEPRNCAWKSSSLPRIGIAPSCTPV
jgi:chorismate mutase/prephenate dehydratase